MPKPVSERRSENMRRIHAKDTKIQKLIMSSWIRIPKKEYV